jgi:uncharacterized protein
MELDSTLEFEWDPVKDETNEKKHDFSFSDAVAVFRDPQHIVEDATRPEHSEQRMMAVGRVGTLVLAVVYTIRSERRRIISARRASRSERERYRQGAESA